MKPGKTETTGADHPAESDPGAGGIKPVWREDGVLDQIQIISRSLKYWTGRDLLPGHWAGAELAGKIFQAPFVLVSHGTEADPVLNYGNAAALALWEMSWTELTRTPSRLN